MQPVLAKNSTGFSDSILDSSPALLVVLDNQRMLVKVNEALTELTGFSKKELSNKNADFLFSSEALSGLDKVLFNLTKKGAKTTSFTANLHSKAGALLKVKWYCSALKDQTKETQYIVCNGFTSEEEAGASTNTIQKKILEAELEQVLHIIENVTVGIYTSDLQGKITYANPAGAKLWGFESVEEVLTQNPDAVDYWHPESRPMIEELIREIIITDKPVLFENIKALKKDGSIFYPKLSARLLKDRLNNPVGIVGSFFDSSEKIRIQEKLLKYEESMKFIFSNTKELIYAVECPGNDSTKFTPIFMSHSITNILGYPVTVYKEFLGSPEKYLHPDDVSARTKMLVEMFETKQSVSCKLRIKHKNGEYIWFDVRLNPTFDENNEIKFFFGHASDITKRVFFEEALKKSESKFRTLFQNASVGIARMSIATQKITEANNVFIEQMGYDSRQHIITDFDIENHLIEKEEWEKIFGFLSSPGSIENVEVRLKKFNGEMFWAQISSKNIPESNEIEAIIVDITERVAFDDQLKKSILEKELLNKEIHHRVKNNLQIISGLLQLQINKISDPLILEPLVQSKDRIETISLVHEKLYQTENISELSFKSYLQEFVDRLKQVYEDRNVTFKLNLPDIYLDAETAVPLALLFNELISNSMKHAFKENTTNNQIKIELESKFMSELFIKYSDNGAGFDTNILQTSSRLGSKLINGLVKQLNGEIKIESKKGKGISVTIKVLKRNG